jgi:hypothetical protein
VRVALGTLTVSPKVLVCRSIGPKINFPWSGMNVGDTTPNEPISSMKRLTLAVGSVLKTTSQETG